MTFVPPIGRTLLSATSFSAARLSAAAARAAIIRRIPAGAHAPVTTMNFSSLNLKHKDGGTDGPAFKIGMDDEDVVVAGAAEPAGPARQAPWQDRPELPPPQLHTATPLAILHGRLARFAELGDGEDPGMVFEGVDTDHDGLISMTQFVDALARLDYEEIRDMHKTIHHLVEGQAKMLEEKLDLVVRIEEELLDLAATAQEKEDVYYNNIGLTTAADIDWLFAKSSLKRDVVGQSVQQLKALIEDARSTYDHSWGSPDGVTTTTSSTSTTKPTTK
jgi:hypothetical protein